MHPHPFPSFIILIVPLLGSCQGVATADAGLVSGTAEPPAPAVVNLPLSTLIDSLHLDHKTIRFHVDKSEREFRVFVNDSLLKTYPCVLGEKPVGDKFHQGDRKTPEGTFTFRSKRVHDAWHKFIWVDYPNAESWRRFSERKAQGLIPDAKDIGGEIGIHGVPDGMDHWIDAGQDWTWGCIALKNADVNEIYPFIVPQRTILVVDP
ncbi:MAG: L,D-transpeptidase family protein [Flavobacteriales bacterium]|nr:L,D-transpeptidase family protein [Flavobacteriales bacterium]MBK6755438.1 L,D-transpeptidase family protein [Flavobacteriales bacterium]MBK7269293.1 L,D-transpeptidase family protein [Flavobacteriales bacterium]MBK9077337.1 L,D-transpeptidase family protein [Flavobacteriales bacterium]MBK9538753.1 L,D-transpeptidase family protein [Flavobacteriales bacterium]